MDLNEECQQCIQLQKQNRLLRNQMIGNKQNLDKERATRIELQSSMKKLRVPYILNPAWVFTLTSTPIVYVLTLYPPLSY